jgi:ABC-type thiamine transport system ATPase subunit
MTWLYIDLNGCSNRGEKKKVVILGASFSGKQILLHLIFYIPSSPSILLIKHRSDNTERLPATKKPKPRIRVVGAAQPLG